MWLLCQWPRRQKQTSKPYLSNLPAKTSPKKLVYLAKLRWRIERDDQDVKSELGLDHFEGRRWRGFRAADGAAFTTPWPASQRPTRPSLSRGARSCRCNIQCGCVAAAHAFLAFERVRFPLGSERLSLLQCRRMLQHVLMRIFGACPLCCPAVRDDFRPPRAPSRMGSSRPRNASG
jgi:hypothetical protein